MAIEQNQVENILIWKIYNDKAIYSPPMWTYEQAKRLLDLFASLVGISLALPILIIAAAAIYLESGGPILFKQVRVGRYGHDFKVYKLRTMYNDAEKNGTKWAEVNDPRITTVGRLLRKKRIDEIPQLINVIRGEMSLVGPRPEVPGLTLQFTQEIPSFIERLQVTPGVTGLAQINGGYNLTPIEKLQLDMEYISTRNIKRDLIILIKTVRIVWSGRGAR